MARRNFESKRERIIDLIRKGVETSAILELCNTDLKYLSKVRREAFGRKPRRLLTPDIHKMIDQGMEDDAIAKAVNSEKQYVMKVRRLKLSNEGKLPEPEAPSLTYATPRPCGPFEELAWKVREREARRRELVLGMLT